MDRPLAQIIENHPTISLMYGVPRVYIRGSKPAAFINPGFPTKNRNHKSHSPNHAVSALRVSW
jgi:hypothetical protein